MNGWKHNKPYSLQNTLNNSTKVTFEQVKSSRWNFKQQKSIDNLLNFEKRNQMLKNESEFES